MKYPYQIKEREQLDALTGIKSSMDKIRSVIAFVYLLFVSNGRLSTVKYSVADGSKIKIDPSLLVAIEKTLGNTDVEKYIETNPLITNQYEPLYVGVTLLLKLGYLRMEGQRSTAERTGGARYPKQIDFASNTLILDLIIKGFSSDVVKKSLLEWLQNKKASNRDFEDRICMFLTTCTVYTQFKLRDAYDNELFFQTEGIYRAITESKSREGVLYADSHELVGPTRIYKNILREDLEPWMTISGDEIVLSGKNNPSADSIGKILSTTLVVVNVKDDSVRNRETKDQDFLDENKKDDNPLQQIFYGAPGTGKSHRIKELTEGKTVIRTTFHPDSDYSTFVGCYKPSMKVNVISKNGDSTKEEQIVYKFVPQAFTRAYVEAWKREEEVFLVIEEINRGNCAQIFGDLFQLLDRKEGVSEYPVYADTDLQGYLKEALADSGRQEMPEDVKSGERLMLPENLYIWATMNTSDQSLFPIDSAFKRRWEWRYMKIKDEEKGYKVKIGEEKQDWWEFVKKINEIIASMTSSADKQIGYFFCKADSDGTISEEMFVGKVLFYLWNDVFKDYGFEDNGLFRYEENGEMRDLTFPDFYGEKNEVKSARVIDFVRRVMEWKKEGKDKE